MASDKTSLKRSDCILSLSFNHLRDKYWSTFHLAVGIVARVGIAW